MTRTCDDCGKIGASLVWEGYCMPLSDVAPTYNEWQDFYLCNDCLSENKQFAKYIQQ